MKTKKNNNKLPKTVTLQLYQTKNHLNLMLQWEKAIKTNSTFNMTFNEFTKAWWTRRQNK